MQIAKNVIGCEKVVGIAGGKEKCDWVKSLGADICVDYKVSPSPFRPHHIGVRNKRLISHQAGNLEKDLRAAVPDYADVYFDNVGGETLDIMLSLVKRYGTVACCGAISRAYCFLS